MNERVPIMLSVAGSDSGGGAGIQADLKTASALGVYGATVLTAVTAQDTHGVHAVHEIPLDMVRAQLDAVLGDFDVRAVKVGMLGSSALVELVAERLAGHPAVVVDPVMVATSGDRLLPPEAEAAVREALVPIAAVVTPNLPEACALTARPSGTPAEELGQALLDAGASAALVKGGHGTGRTSDDVLVDAGGAVWFRGERVDTPNTHGTGCTLSSAIASGLVLGQDLPTAVREAKEFLHEALVSGARRTLGNGHGPDGRAWDGQGSDGHGPVDHLVRR